MMVTDCANGSGIIGVQATTTHAAMEPATKFYI